MRAVLDTNTLVSGLLWRGASHRLLATYVPNGDLVPCTSPPLLSELHRVLSYPRLQFQAERMVVDVHQSLATVLQRTEVYPSIPEISLIKEDPSDNVVLATALVAKADAIISGDRHLRQLKDFAIPVLNSAEALRELRTTT